MQPAATLSDIQTPLVDRYISNQRMVRESARRMTEVRALTRASRGDQQRLLAEVRLLLQEVRGGLDLVRDARTGPVEAPTTHRYSRPEPDPVDSERRLLHERYRVTGDPAIRAELMRSYDGFARSLALKFRHREASDDLFQVARIGLLHAIDRFDPALGRPFPLFARITITGELKRHLRDKTWAMRVPRSLQEDYLAVMRAVDELTGEQSDSPSISAVAERCGISDERVLEAMELRVSQRALSIDMPPTAGSDDPVIEVGQEDRAFDQFESRQLLSHLLDRLPERDRRIVELRFFDELTQSEIASEIGVSQMCVSRVLARTLGRLRLWARTALS